MKTLFTRQTLLRTAILTAVFEAFTALCRFGLNMVATRDTASTIGAITLGVCVHHSYLGIVLAAIAFFGLKSRPAVARWLLAVGMALICSDLLHHFVVLWLATCDPAFDLLYPREG